MTHRTAPVPARRAAALQRLAAAAAVAAALLGAAGAADSPGCPAADASVAVTSLRCEDLSAPLGLDAASPRLSWILESPGRGVRQSAYWILVASRPDLLEPGRADVWDSGRVASPRSVQVSYAGRPLLSRTRYHWKVRIWDGRGAESAWSAPAWWETGLLKSGDWTASWIGLRDVAPVALPETAAWVESTAWAEPKLETRAEILERLAKLAPAVHLRKGFRAAKAIRRARAYVCGLGYYELYLNGRRIGDHALDPAQTDYETRALYATYDVTDALRVGENAVGAILGDGFYAQTVSEFASKMEYGTPGLIFQLDVDYADGTSFRLASDPTWKGAAGPILKSNVFAGEVYDARREMAGWAAPGFDDAAWRPAEAMPPLSPRLESQAMPAVRRIETLRPVRVTAPGPGVRIYDFGRNISGWARLSVEAPRGTALRLRFAEFMETGGSLSFLSTGPHATGVVQTDLYICRGGARETWEPRFTSHGFRYAELSGFTGEPGPDALEAVVVRSALEPAGAFASSDEILDRVHALALRTFEANLIGIPTDCPARERAGWLGDAHVTVEALLFAFDMAPFWRKYIRDVETTTDLKKGVPAAVAPGRRRVGNPPDWGVATIFLPWYLYLYTGDDRLLEEHYPYMRSFSEFFASQADAAGIVSAGLGDWWDPTRASGDDRAGGGGKPQNTAPALTSTAYLHYSAKLMAAIAERLGKPGDAETFRARAERAAASFNRAFFDATYRSYGSQTADALALYMGLVPAGQERRVAESLARDVAETWSGHASAGSHGATRLYWALGKYGHDDVAYAILRQDGYPGFRHLFSLGATTLWERMGSLKPGQAAPEGSLSHPFHGGYDAWFYQGVAGIEPDPARPGFEHFFLKPELVRQIARAEARYRSVRGLIRSAWRAEGGAFLWNVTVPGNASATISVPTADAEAITEGAEKAAAAPGVRFVRVDGGYAVFEIGSGDYAFRSPIAGGAGPLK
jgi:alpha-L-rhamnosidase